jgi:hypothetical protein
MKVCQVHGGATPRGIASVHYKTGRYSKYLPQRMREAYALALDDPQLLEQREQIAVLDARLFDLLGRVDTGESGALWQRLMTARMELLEAQRTKDHLGQLSAMRTILDLISQGHTDYRAWGEIASVLEQRKRLIESERKRLTEMQQMVTSQQAMGLISAILESVKRNVTDRAALAAIQTDFIRLTTRDDRTIVDVG